MQEFTSHFSRRIQSKRKCWIRWKCSTSARPVEAPLFLSSLEQGLLQPAKNIPENFIRLHSQTQDEQFNQSVRKNLLPSAYKHDRRLTLFPLWTSCSEHHRLFVLTACFPQSHTFLHPADPLIDLSVILTDASIPPAALIHRCKK